MTLIPSSQTFACLNARSRWTGARLAGLEVDSDGALVLSRVAAGASIDRAGPYDPPLTGFAAGPRGELAFATQHRLMFRDPCRGELVLELGGIVALAIRDRWLYAADETQRCVHVLLLSGLERFVTWSNVGAPARLATDGEGRLYILDRSAGTVLRLDAHGRRDGSYVAADTDLAGALDLFVATDGTAFVSVDGGEILRFAPAGGSVSRLAAPADAPGFRPGALTGDDEQLVVADRTSGTIWTYAINGDDWLGALAAVRAPVTGLAVSDAHLHVRTDATTDHVPLSARRAYVARGRLEAGPFDAGEHRAWLRVHVEAMSRASASIRLETALAASTQPAALTWVLAPSADTLVRPPGLPEEPADPNARFLWIRVHVRSGDPAQTPRLAAVVAETPGEDLMAQLPAVYARTDATAHGQLRTWLEGVRAELGDREREIGELASRLDPAVAPADHLAWLASWVALDLPPHTNPTADRALLLDAHALYQRRGTVAGLREMVRIYTGIECEIVEAFGQRRLWALDGTARLGFDTGLAGALPDGMVVPGPSRIVPALQGLASETFLDDHLGTSAEAPGQGGDRCRPHVATPTTIDPDGTFPRFAVPSPAAGKPLRAFSVRWTGQLRPRYSELYTFSFAHDGGARVYVDGNLIVDTWSQPGAGERRGRLPLTADRWVSVRIEYWSANLNALAPRLSWASASQLKQPVPKECLYALDDDNVDPGVDPHDGSIGPIVVGELVVGMHGPLAAEDFGSPLFADEAHRFTVRVQARDVRCPDTLHAIRAVLDAEKPAHTDYHLCVIEPHFRVGQQATLGVDAVVAPADPPGRLGESELGVDARLGMAAGRDDRSLRVEETLRLGHDSILR